MLAKIWLNHLSNYLSLQKMTGLICSTNFLTSHKRELWVVIYLETFNSSLEKGENIQKEIGLDELEVDTMIDGIVDRVKKLLE